MSVDKSDILKTAELAKLSITEAEMPNYLKDISAIIDMVGGINAADTEGIEPLSHPLQVTARLRPDEIHETNQRDCLQKIAPDVADGYYLVPKVIT